MANENNLPATVADLLKQRKSLRVRSLHDDVEQIHLVLFENPDYRKWFVPVHQSECVEGSFMLDDAMVAQMIREYAKKNDFVIAAQAKLAAICFSLGVVCRRYNMGRKQRRSMVSGQHVDLAEVADAAE